ncbi:MAG: TlpA family protein disulfide reductase [Myxococcales bacterium]
MKILLPSLLAAFLLASAPTATVKLTESGNARVGSAAPSFGGWDLAGRRVLTLDGIRRTPAMASLLITFGASFCKPCNEGLPRMVALTKKHPELRLVLIDVEPDSQKAQEFAQRVGMDGPAILDKFQQIAKTYGVAHEETTELPRTFLVDQMGKVRAIYKEEGPDLESLIVADLEAARTAVRPASAEGK